MPAAWMPGADTSHKAGTDGGSILGGKPKVLWHDTETSGLPSYSSGSFPHFTVDPKSGHIWQHIPVNRAARALKNVDGGCQTNRWNVIQVEIIGYVNKIPYHAALGEIAAWAASEWSVPATSDADRLSYDASYGSTHVRFSCSEWDAFSGHCYHMSAPENDHGDPGDPFPMNQILAAAGGEEDDLNQAQHDRLKRIYQGFIVSGSTGAEDTINKLYDRVKSVRNALATQGGASSPETTMNDLFAQVRQSEADVKKLCDAAGIPFEPVDTSQFASVEGTKGEE
jgi:hypothetical protein